MAHFGFNYTTDECLDKLDELGIYHRRQGTMVEIFTEQFDVDEAQERDGLLAKIFDLVHYERPKKVKQQGLRIWLHPETHVYYYLIKDVVFKMYEKRSKDYSTSPPTVVTVSVFDVVEKSEQDYWRSILMRQPPNFSGVIPRLI